MPIRSAHHIRRRGLLQAALAGGALVAAGHARAADPEFTEEALARRQRSIDQLREDGVPVLPTLPPIQTKAEVRPRSAAELAQRSACLLVVSLKGEANDPAVYRKAMADSGIKLSAFSPKERAFVEDPAPSRSALIDYSWRYECLAVTMWAQGLWELGPATGIVDVKALVQAYLDARTRDPASAKPPVALAKVLDMADLTYRQDWAVTEARVQGQPMPGGLDAGVVLERHRASGWLIGGTGWDDVDMST